MAIDMNAERPLPERVSLLTFAEEHGALLIGLAVAVIVFLLYRHSVSTGAANSSTQTGGQQADLSGLSTDANGNPIVYVPTSTEFYTDNSVNATSAEGAPATITENSPTSTTTSTSTTTTNPPPVISPPVVGPPVIGPIRAGPITHTLIVRNSRAGDTADQKNKGVVIRSQPGGGVDAVVKFGSTQNITAGPVAGPTNKFQNGQGPSSNQWYLIPQGYISAIDVASVS